MRIHCIFPVIFIYFTVLLNDKLVYCQTVVSNDECEEKSIKCPRENDASFKTKCCVEFDGGQQLYTCCNPIFGVYVGLGVVIPIIGCTIIILVSLCICWSRYKRKKLARITEMYLSRCAEIEDVIDAPPPYTANPDENGKRNNELPVYTRDDPHSQLPPPVYGGNTQPETLQESISVNGDQPETLQESVSVNGDRNDTVPLINEDNI